MAETPTPLQEDGRGTQHRVAVPPSEDGARLDRLLAAALPALSRSRLKALIEAGQVQRAGPPTGDSPPVLSPSQKVQSGQIFLVTVPPPQEAKPQGQAMALDIYFEDADLLVLDKPAGLVVHPGAGNPDGTLVNALIAHCGDSLQGIGGERRPGIVHRLDKLTSGLMVAAKTETAHRALVAQFAAREISRCYAALVWGVPTAGGGEISGNIGRSPRNRKKMAVLARGGRPAVTRYRVERHFGQGLVSLLTCRLLTGRTHQIRVHLSDAGHPLLGDPLYGRAGPQRQGALNAAAKAALLQLGRQALHAKTLGFRHPSSGKALEFESPLPRDINDLISSLETL